MIVLLRSTKMILHELVIYFTSRGILIVLVQISHVIMYVVHPFNLFFWLVFHRFAREGDMIFVS